MSLCGTRRSYQWGCRCARCRRAEADYRRRLRTDLCKGRLPLGCRVNARQTWRLITRLVKAGYTKPQIAGFLGLKRPRLELHTETVIQATALRISALYDSLMAEGPELPCR